MLIVEPAQETAALRRLLALTPADPSILHRLGRDSADLATHLARAAATAPHPQIFYEIGNAHLASDFPTGAWLAYRRSIALEPSQTPVLANAGEALARDNRIEDAIVLHRRALAVKGDAALALANLAQAWSRLGWAETALRSARQAIALAPSLMAAHVNAGLATQGLARRAEAETGYRRALAVDAGCAEAAFALGTARLADGDLATGFRLYEARFHLAEMRSWRDRRRAAAWDGVMKPGLRLLLRCEQGFGDTIQFIRYAPILARAGAQVIIACPEPLRRLINDQTPMMRTCRPEDPPEVDAEASLMSLPYLLGTTLESIPAEVPYLAAIAGIRSDAAMASGLRIGLAWAGRPEHRTDRTRSLPPDSLRDLAATLSGDDRRLFSLQVGPRRQDLGAMTTPIVDLGPDFNDFADTAAAIAGLDLVVAVDSAVAHLSAALGRRTWLMLPHVAEWRWLDSRADSPWYPTMRLFRQTTAGDWTPMIAEIGREAKRLRPARR